MSTRAMSRMYRGSGSYRTTPDDNSPGLLEMLFPPQVSGGVTKNAQGRYDFAPYQGVKGFGAKRRASQMNEAIGPALIGIQGEMDIQEIIGKQQKELEDLKGKLAKEKDFRDAFIKSISAIPGAIDVNGNLTTAGKEFVNNTAVKLAENATREAIIKGKAFDPNINPDIQANANVGANIGMSTIPPASLTGNAGPMEVGSRVGLPGVNFPSGTAPGMYNLIGGSQRQTVKTNELGLPTTVTENLPGSVEKIPANPKAKETMPEVPPGPPGFNPFEPSPLLNQSISPNLSVPPLNNGLSTTPETSDSSFYHPNSLLADFFRWLQNQGNQPKSPYNPYLNR